jgi:DNA-binding XRE family transcriptional regulator
MSLRLKEQYIDDISSLFLAKCLYMHYLTSNIKNEIGRNITKLRRAKGLKQVDVATDADVNPSYYGKIERGLVNPSLEKLYKIIKTLGIKSSDILPF